MLTPERRERQPTPENLHRRLGQTARHLLAQVEHDTGYPVVLRYRAPDIHGSYAHITYATGDEPHTIFIIPEALSSLDYLISHECLHALRLFVEKAVLALGGAILPDGDTCRIEAPEALVPYPNVGRRYSDVTFNRDLAMRSRKTQLLGLGHPLVDALIAHLQNGGVGGEVATLPRDDSDILSVRCVFTADARDGRPRKEYRDFRIGEDGSWSEAPPRADSVALEKVTPGRNSSAPYVASDSLREQVRYGIAAVEASIRAQTESRSAVRSRLVGIALVDAP